MIPYATRLVALSRSQPTRRALTTIDGSGVEVILTYEALQQRVSTYAANLRRIADRGPVSLAVLLANDAQNVAAAAAGWYVGAFVVPLNPNAPTGEIADQLELIRSRGHRVLVVVARALADSQIAELGVKAEDVVEVATLGEPTTEFEEPSPLSMPARAVCSGGTTGRPKLIVDETPWAWSGRESVLDKFGWTEAATVLVYSPLYHGVGATLTHWALMAGKSVVLLSRFSAELALKAIRDAAVEFFFAVPTHMQRILGLEGVAPADFAGVRGMYHSGAQCPPSLKRQWLALLGPHRVWELYGATDGCGFTLINGTEWLEHPGSVGRPVGTDIRVLDADLREVAAGTIGTIFLAPSGATAAPAPFSYIGAEMPALVDGRFRTAGDMGRVDDEGYLYIADRRTDMIISGGANVFPAEIEAALVEHPQVDEAAVIGLPDEAWGRRIHAIVKSRDAGFSDWRDLDRHCRERIAAYKVPKTYEFVAELPRTEVGKVRRAQLVEERLPRRGAEAAE